MNTHQDFVADAIGHEAAIVAKAQASTRNHILNRAAFNLGRIPGTQLGLVVGGLLPAASANGYVADHGEYATRKVIESGFQSGQRKQRDAPQPNRAERRRMASESRRTADRGPSPTVVSQSVNAPLAQHAFPPRTPPDKDGKPSFLIGGNEGPPTWSDEIRRHVFVREDLEPVRIKIMRKGGGAVNWYRVHDADGTLGWQAKKPETYIEVPYVGGADPFDREVVAEEL